ncbi:MAG TPA: hypothetical protein VFL13_04335 [Candidatus Baltobacteraceae bacterium]|nr:hypothetical protein [Candidatus Baltobacteraceae bacterium]
MDEVTYKRLIEALESRMPGAVVDFGPKVFPNRVSGLIQWDGFAEMNVTERQDFVWGTIRGALGPESADVSTIVTLTPQELADFNEAV